MVVEREGVTRVEGEEGREDKELAVGVDALEFSLCKDGAELPPHRLREIQQFLKDYKSLEGKIARVGTLQGARKAHSVIKSAAALYRDDIYPTLGVPSSKRR